MKELEDARAARADAEQKCEDWKDAYRQAAGDAVRYDKERQRCEERVESLAAALKAIRSWATERQYAYPLNTAHAALTAEERAKGDE